MPQERITMNRLQRESMATQMDAAERVAAALEKIAALLERLDKRLDSESTRPTSYGKKSP